MLLFVVLFLVGLLGGSFPLFFNRDGSSLIIIGFGAGLLIIHNKIKEGAMEVRNPGSVIALTVIAAFIGIAAMVYNVLKFGTSFNKVLSVGFIILLIWEVLLCIVTLKSKAKK